MADWSSIASEWVETDRRRDTRTTTLDAASSSSSEGSRGRQLIADSILSALPVIPTDGPQSFHRLGPNLILPSLLARPNSDPEVSDSSAKDDDNDGSARSSVSSMKGMRTLRPVTASYVIELAEGTHQDRMIRELASTVHLIVHPTNDPVAMERMYDIFASRKVHLHGVWLADLWFYTRNSNPLLGLGFAHIWHPFKKLDRMLILLAALLAMFLCCGLFAARDCCMMKLDGPASRAAPVASLDNLSFADLAAEGSASGQDGSASIDSILGTLWDSLQSSVSSTDVSASTSLAHSAAPVETDSSSGSSSSSRSVPAIPSNSASASVEPPTDSASGAGNTMEISIKKPTNGQYGIKEPIPIEWTLARVAGTKPLITQFQIEFSPDGGATFSQIASTVTPSSQGGDDSTDGTSLFHFDWDSRRTDWYLCTDCVLRICAMEPTSFEKACIRSDGESANATSSSALTLALADGSTSKGSDTGTISFQIVNETLVCSCGLEAENYVVWAFIIAICLPLITRLLQPLVTFYHDSKCYGLFARQGREKVPRLGYYGAKATRKGRLVVLLVVAVLAVLSGLQLDHVYKSDTLSTQTDSTMELWGVTFALCVAIGFIYCLVVDSVVFSARWWHSVPSKPVPEVVRIRSGSAPSSSSLDVHQLA